MVTQEYNTTIVQDVAIFFPRMVANVCMEGTILNNLYVYLKSEIDKGYDDYNDFTFLESKGKIDAFRNIKELLDDYYFKTELCKE
jgi:hypothetical protein